MHKRQILESEESRVYSVCSLWHSKCYHSSLAWVGETSSLEMFTLGDIILLPWLGWEKFFSRNVHAWRGYYSSLGLVGKTTSAWSYTEEHNI